MCEGVMVSKESLEAKYKAARELNSNKAYCEYLDVALKYSKLKQLINSEDYWESKRKLLEEGRNVIGYQKPLLGENRNKYRNALDELHEKIVKLMEDEAHKRAKLISNVKWTLGITIPIIIAVFLYLNSIKNPDILITQAAMSNLYLRGNTLATTPMLTFTATAVGERDVQTGVNFSIVFVNQSKSSTCGNATFFYYPKREICQYNISSQLGQIHKACGFSSIAPPTLSSGQQYITVTQDIVDHEINHFLNVTKKNNVTSCQINESIKVCSSYECNGDIGCLKNCSGAFPVLIKYN